MPNPNPEGRIGLALLLIGVISAYAFFLWVSAGNAVNPFVVLGLAIVLIVGWSWYRSSRPPKPPPPPKKSFGDRAKARFSPPPKKPAAPPPPKPAGPPPAKKGALDFLKPKIKAPPKK
ncbi:MAG: hypothetical protein HY269_03480 [Deltaproteobacteria bacterium]|nr:hypothetical protein [Deltaproteobacteria bacterium]